MGSEEVIKLLKEKLPTCLGRSRDPHYIISPCYVNQFPPEECPDFETLALLLTLFGGQKA